MSEVCRINLNKLKLVFLFTSLLLGIFVAICFGFAYSANQVPASALRIQIGFISLIAFPILICIIALSTWYLAHTLQKKFFESVKDSHLIPLGFKPIIINVDNKWKFADEVYHFENSPQEIIVRQNKHQKSTIEFCFYNESFDENLVEREIKMTKKEFYSMSSDTIKSMLLKTTLS